MKTDPDRIKPYDQSVNASTTVTADGVDVSGYAEMTVIWRLLATVTAGDLTQNDVRPYIEDVDGTDTLVPMALPASGDNVVAPVSDGTNVVAMKRFRVAGLKTVQLQGRNNNLGARTLEMHVLLSP